MISGVQEHPRPVPTAGRPFLKPSEARDTRFLLSYTWRGKLLTERVCGGGGELERKLVLKEGWKPRGGRIEVKHGERLVWPLWWRRRSEVLLLTSKAGTGCCASWPARVCWLQRWQQHQASGDCDQQAALCQPVLVPQLHFERKPWSHYSTPSCDEGDENGELREIIQQSYFFLAQYRKRKALGKLSGMKLNMMSEKR